MVRLLEGGRWCYFIAVVGDEDSDVLVEAALRDEVRRHIGDQGVAVRRVRGQRR